MKRTLKERLEEQIYYGLDGCWYWTGPLAHKGYGRISMPGKDNMWLDSMKVHRASYEVFKGPIPKGMMICHTCDHPSCLNPDHLFCGSAKDNSDDKIKKGRARYVRGSQQGKAKFTEREVAVIKRLQGSIRVSHLAKAFGVCHSTIASIWNGDNWKHVA